MLLFWVKYILGKGLGILDDFLSVDSSQDLSGWFSFKSILPKRGSAFYINGVFFGFSHGRRALQLLRFLRFRSWLGIYLMTFEGYAPV